ncbi:MAG: bifunctional riboflavin kinase/FAD synthetase [Flavobacteriales bacterium]
MQNAVVTIGTFDGVHQGHAALLKRITELAREVGGESVLLTFYPHPRMVLYPDDHNISLITSPEEKNQLLDECGLDHLVIYPFSTAFSRMSAFEYVRDLLVKGLNAHTVVVGYDHRFGRNREGDFQTLLELSEVFGFHVEEISAQDVDAILVSSTKVRNALIDGRIEEANLLLGRPYAIEGHVVRSRQLGRTIGFPTANLKPDYNFKLIPSHGVYVSRAHTPFGIFNAITNIGIRPTVSEELQRNIETHIFDFAHELYEEPMKIELHHFIREEQKFASLDELKNAITQDCNYARAWHSQNTSAH